MPYREMLRDRWLSPAILTAGAVLAGALLAIQLKSQSETVEANFRAAAQSRYSAIKKGLDGASEGIAQVAAFIDVTSPLSRQQFGTYALRQLETTPGLQALEWIPRVAAGDLAPVEAAKRAEAPSFQIRERGADGQLRPVSGRAEYFPVYYVEPYRSNERALGFDLGSEPVRRTALLKAAETGRPVATSRVTLVQETGSQYGVLVFYPLYIFGSSPQTAEGRRADLIGFALSVVRLGDLVETALRQSPEVGLRIVLCDESAPDETRPLYVHESRPKPAAGENSRLTSTTAFTFADRHWSITVTPAPGYFEGGFGWTLWLPSLAVMLLALLLAAYLEVTRRQRRVLAESESRLELALRSSNMGVWSWDFTTQQRTFDSEACRLLGVEHRKERVTEAEFFSRVHPDDLPSLRAAQARTVQGDAPYGPEFRTIWPDGTEHFVTSRGRLIRDSSGRPVGINGIVWDITEKKSAERALEAAKARAESASQLKSIFLANMSHEIRTPLNAIIGFAHLLRTELRDPSQGTKLARIDLSARHLLGIIDDILDISKIEADHLVIETEPFVLVAVLQQACELTLNQATAKGLTFLQDFDDRLKGLVVSGDALRLRQILVNLLSNAFKFTDRGHVTLRATLLSETADQFAVRLEVEDTGIGLSPEQQARLFTPFEQAESSTTRKFGGTGLGLAICAKLAQIMGGTTGVRSAPHRGSTFWVSLPFTRGELPAGRMERTTPSPVLSLLHGTRVLLVEDNEINQEVAQHLLEGQGITVDVAGDGAAAVERVRARRYDVVLMDVQMPTMDGLEATRLIRTLPGCQDLPIIAMTATALAEERQRCLEAGMNDFVSKPVEPTHLFGILDRWLKKPATASAPAAMPAGTPSTPPGRPVIDPQIGIRYLGGNATAYLRILGRFPAREADAAGRIRQALAMADTSGARRLAHTLKSTAGTLGMEALNVVAAELEQALDENRAMGAADGLLERLEQALAAAVRAAESIVSTGDAAAPAAVPEAHHR